MPSGGNWKEMVHACETGDIALVKYHLQTGIDPNYQHPEFLTSPLIESLRFGQTAIAKLLLENGANPSAVEGFDGDTPLSLAKASKNFKAIELLNQYLPEAERMPIKNVLITGGNRGIGKAIAQQILSEGHRVVITCRKQSIGEATVEELKQKTQNESISLIVGDLSNIKSTIALANQIKAQCKNIDTLIHNAGVWKVEKQLNEDQLEESFMVNYLARCILTQELFPLLKQNSPSRIINVNAGLYVKGAFDPEKTPTGLDFHSIKTYANSKLCEILFTIDFARQIEGTGVSINAVHPGIIQTGLGNSPKLISKFVNLVKKLWKKPDYGAIAPTWLAISKEAAKFNGFYFNEKERKEYIAYVQDEQLQQTLKRKTEELLKNS
ncbi:MAG: SDR family NAD(P)-dependent oxidoreductase [Chitinophagales bacterium]